MTAFTPRKPLLAFFAILTCLAAAPVLAQSSPGEARPIIEDLRQQLAAKDGVIAELKTQLASNTDSLQGVSTMIGELEKKLAERHADLADMRDQLDRALARVKEREAAADDLNSKLAAAGGEKARAVDAVKTQRLILAWLLAAALVGIVFAWRRKPAAR